MANPITQIILTAVDKTRAAFASVKGGLASIGDSAGGLKSTLGSIFTGLSVVGFIGQIKAAADEMDNALDSAQAAGTSIENFTGLAYASGQNGGGPEVLQKSLVKLNEGLKESADAGSKAATTWRTLGLDPKQFDDSADALLAIADRFAAMPDGIYKTNLAVDLFGEKIGPRMIPLLNKGRAGIKDLTDEARRLGKVLDTETAQAADRFNDTLDRLNARKVSIFARMLPSIEKYVSALDDVIERGSIIDNIAFFSTGFISEETMNRISKAGDRVQDYNTEIFKLQQQLLELRRVESADSPNIQIWEKRIADLEKTRAELAKKSNEDRLKNTKDTNDEIGKSHEAAAELFKTTTKEQISDAERLQRDLQTAFVASIASEKDYLRQAKKLRDEANGSSVIAGDPESQASAKLGAIAALMQLQREAGTASLDSLQQQADAVRELSAQLDDAALKQDLTKQANLAEAAALEKAAAEEKDRYRGLAEQQAESARQAENLKAALDGIGKETSIDIKTLPSVKQTTNELNDLASAFNNVIARKAEMDKAFGGLDTSKLSEGLRQAALKYGSRK
jgi:hypothetical protein